MFASVNHVKKIVIVSGKDLLYIDHANGLFSTNHDALFPLDNKQFGRVLGPDSEIYTASVDEKNVVNVIRRESFMFASPKTVIKSTSMKQTQNHIFAGVMQINTDGNKRSHAIVHSKCTHPKCGAFIITMVDERDGVTIRFAVCPHYDDDANIYHLDRLFPSINGLVDTTCRIYVECLLSDLVIIIEGMEQYGLITCEISDSKEEGYRVEAGICLTTPLIENKQENKLQTTIINTPHSVIFKNNLMSQKQYVVSSRTGPGGPVGSNIDGVNVIHPRLEFIEQQIDDEILFRVESPNSQDPNRPNQSMIIIANENNGIEVVSIDKQSSNIRVIKEFADMINVNFVY
jgi:hypothetical protein